jgi:hypothetical protein
VARVRLFPSEKKSLNVECPAGTKVISGGGIAEQGGQITQSAPTPVGEGGSSRRRATTR